MERETVVLILARLLFSAAAAYLSILLWAKTRDTAWMFVMAGIIVSYAENLYSGLVSSGIVAESGFAPAGIPVVRLVGTNLPMLLFCIGFIVMIARRKTP
jgi:hypothetical protein